jgi:EAL domain-containing protein (putative c-di-GMP-specific phosphodiesterase class I)
MGMLHDTGETPALLLPKEGVLVAIDDRGTDGSELKKLS